MSNFIDVIGKANISEGLNYSYTSNRFYKNKTAILLNSGFLKMSPDVYFSGDFTVIVWINLIKFDNETIFFDFGNEQQSDVAFYINKTISADICDSYDCSSIQTDTPIDLDKWHHMVLSLKDTVCLIYLNGTQIGNATLNRPENITRNNSFIGKRNWQNESTSIAVYSDLKIYRGALSSDQVLDDYTTSSSNSK